MQGFEDQQNCCVLLESMYSHHTCAKMCKSMGKVNVTIHLGIYHIKPIDLLERQISSHLVQIQALNCGRFKDYISPISQHFQWSDDLLLMMVAQKCCWCFQKFSKIIKHVTKMILPLVPVHSLVLFILTVLMNIFNN